MNVFGWAIFWLYRLLLIPGLNLLARLLLPVTKGKLKEFLNDRLPTHLPPLSAPCIWIHASSGEVEYAKALIRKIKTEWPQKPVIVSYFSPSAKKLMQKFAGIDAFFALPLENRKEIRKLIEHFRPEVLLFARTDVWPELAFQFRARNIPRILFSATLVAKSSRTGLFAKVFTRFTMNLLSEIHCVSDGDFNEFTNLQVKTPVYVTGDTRYDQVLYRLANPLPVKLALKPTEAKKILVCGSTWPEDEKILIPAMVQLQKKGFRCILAPHETSKNRLQMLQYQLQQSRLSFSLYSQANNWTSDILLIDCVGILQEIYTWGNYAFVGGSFKDKVHSVMEPLAAGLPVMVGPFHHNNREALQFQHFLQGQVALVQVIKNSYELESALEKIQPVLEKLQQKINLKIQEKAGASDKLLLRLKNQLP